MTRQGWWRRETDGEKNARPADTRLSEEVVRTRDEKGDYFFLCCRGSNVYFILYREKTWPPCHSALLPSLHNATITGGGQVISQVRGEITKEDWICLVIVMLVDARRNPSLVLLAKLFTSFVQILAQGPL